MYVLRALRIKALPVQRTAFLPRFAVMGWGVRSHTQFHQIQKISAPQTRTMP